jgi:LmbE family N-acetylglucosaminyl deacetylase
MWNCKKVLALAPHTDDVEFGAGGLVAKLINEGAEVITLAFSNAWRSLPPGLPKDTLLDEARNASKKLGQKTEHLNILDFPVRDFYSSRQAILEVLCELNRKNTPDLVLVPATTDMHQDHQVVTQEGIRAFRTTTILGYELPWNNIQFRSSALVPLSESDVQQKIDAIAEFKSQSHRPYFEPEFIRGWLLGRGVTAGVKFAEAYEVIRWVIK